MPSRPMFSFVLWPPVFFFDWNLPLLLSSHCSMINSWLVEPACLVEYKFLFQLQHRGKASALTLSLCFPPLSPCPLSLRRDVVSATRRLFAPRLPLFCNLGQSVGSLFNNLFFFRFPVFVPGLGKVTLPLVWQSPQNAQFLLSCFRSFNTLFCTDDLSA